MSERFERIENLFLQALELRPEERGPFLDTTCAGDRELRSEIESLLEHDGASEERIAEALQGTAQSLFETVSIKPGTRLGDYEVQKLIGAGGMGEVYRARDTRLARDVAIKVLPSFLRYDPGRLRRFEQEAQAAAALNHSNILAVHQMGSYQGAPYMVSELLEGATLREQMRRGPLPWRAAIEYGVQIAHGLAAAHEKGIAHRDLKPENLFLTKAGRVKILDFGLAKLIDAPRGPGPGGVATEAGLVMGTAGYMAPEQVRGEAADYRADFFAFGAILYEMLSGRPAFQKPNSAETMSAVLNEDPPGISQIAPATPPALQRVVRRCLEKNREQRFQSASDLAFALEALSDSEIRNAPTEEARQRHSQNDLSFALESRSETASQVWREPAFTQPQQGHRERTAWLLVAVLLVLVAVVGFAYFRLPAKQQRAMHFSIALPSSVRDLALSPDGRILAFIAPPPGGGGNVLWTREIGSTETHVLANTEGASYPFWSPDARFIGFFADGKLKRIEVAGGPVQILADAPRGRGGAWNRQGTIIFAPNPVTGLARVSAAGGVPTPVTEIPGAPNFANLSHRWPIFLPDGVHFLYTMNDFSGVQGKANDAIYAGALGSKEQRRLAASNSNSAYVSPGYLVSSQSGTLMAQRFDADRLQLIGEPFAVADSEYLSAVARTLFSVSQNGVLVYQTGSSTSSELQWFNRGGKPLSAIGTPARYANPRISPDGHKVAVDIDDPQSNPGIWLLNLENGVRSRFTFDPASAEETPIWSPDGTRVLWMSLRNEGTDFYVKAATGLGGEELITRSSPTLLGLPTDWSRDGQFLLYTTRARPDWNLQIAVLPLRGDRKPLAFAHSQSSEREGQFSPDGRWVAYSSNESARWEIYVVPFPGAGGKYQISTEGGQQPRWRRDGKELFFLSPDKKLMAVSVKVGATFEFREPVALFQTRAREALSSEEDFTYDVSLDGQRFLINVNPERSNPQPVNIVLNWTSEIQRK